VYLQSLFLEDQPNKESAAKIPVPPLDFSCSLIFQLANLPSFFLSPSPSVPLDLCPCPCPRSSFVTDAEHTTLYPDPTRHPTSGRFQSIIHP
jgi:hypothetical protein